MNKYIFEINKRLPSFNEYTRQNRANKYAGAEMKKREEDYIYLAIKNQLGNLKIKNPVKVNFLWIEENGKRDLDNICFAKKFILDALVKAKVIENDNRKYILGFMDNFEYASFSKVIVELEESIN